MNTHMQSAVVAGGGLLALVIMGTSVLPLSAEARVRYASTTQWTQDSRTLVEQIGRSRYNSATQKAIAALDSDPVTKFPIPVLMGVRVADLTPNFGDARDGGARTHEGQDIMAPLGSLIVSPTKAVVIKTGTGEGAGTYVYTANPGGEIFAYMHLNSIPDSVKVGAKLNTGDLIGYVGNTGNAAGGAPHLHFEIRKNREAIDPYSRLTREFTTLERIDALETLLAFLLKSIA